MHSLRRTWEPIANDEGITELDQHVLSNHSFGSHNVNATYISQHIDRGGGNVGAANAPTGTAFIPGVSPVAFGGACRQRRGSSSRFSAPTAMSTADDAEVPASQVMPW